MSLRASLVFLFALFVLEAEAATVNLLGSSIEAAIPTGYCEVGAQPAEAEIVSRTREGIGNSNQILAMFADCKELADFQKGRRTMLDNYGQILAQIPKGQLRALKGVSRSEYIQKMSGQVKKFPEALRRQKLASSNLSQGSSSERTLEYLAPTPTGYM